MLGLHKLCVGHGTFPVVKVEMKIERIPETGLIKPVNKSRMFGLQAYLFTAPVASTLHQQLATFFRGANRIEVKSGDLPIWGRTGGVTAGRYRRRGGGGVGAGGGPKWCNFPAF